MAKRSKRRNGSKNGDGALPMILHAHRSAFHDAYYQSIIDQTYEALKDPEWQDFMFRMTEEFAQLLLKSVRRLRKARDAGSRR